MTEPVSPYPSQPRFFQAEEVGQRPWGKEWLVAHIPGVATGKVLEMREGAKGGLQKHHLKNESQYIVSGKMLFRYVDEGEIRERVLGPGDCVHILPGQVHQEEALTDVTVFEISTAHFNDRVRMEEEFGLEIPEGGLPSTTLEEVEVR